MVQASRHSFKTLDAIQQRVIKPIADSTLLISLDTPLAPIEQFPPFPFIIITIEYIQLDKINKPLQWPLKTRDYTKYNTPIRSN